MPATLENSAVVTGLEKVSFHSHPKERQLPKNAQTTTQLYSSHMASKVMLKILQARLQQYFQMFKMVWAPKITADGDCSHEIKRCLFLGRKVMTNLDSIFKSRDITLPTKVRLVKAMVFPLVMYGCES